MKVLENGPTIVNDSVKYVVVLLEDQGKLFVKAYEREEGERWSVDSIVEAATDEFSSVVGIAYGFNRTFLPVEAVLLPRVTYKTNDGKSVYAKETN